VAEAPIPASELVRKKSPAAAAPSRYGLTVLAGQAQGHRYRLAGSGCMIGRSKGAIVFADDPFLSAHHASLLIREGRLFVRDESSVSGLFVSIIGQELIPAGAFFAAGRRLFRYLGPLPRASVPPGQPVPYGAPVVPNQALYGLEEVLVGGRAGREVISSAPLLTIGRQSCDFTFPEEPGLAPRHCEVSPMADGSAILRDLSGGLGTFVRLPAGLERPLGVGDRFRLGQEVIQVELAA
jgi:pSer/pThr/pTyr-binding forkhead associated (FHA) protein